MLATSGEGYFASRAEFNPFTHTWSLAVEEQFYLVFPLLLAVAILHPSESRRRIGLTVLASLFAASLAWCAWATSHAAKQAFYLLAPRFWELAVGAATCLAGPAVRTRVVGVLGARALSLASLATLFWVLALAPRAGIPFPWVIPAVLATALLICVVDVAPRAPGPARWLASAPMVTVGLLSYSLYLWHWPVFTVFRWTIGLEGRLECMCALALAATLAVASYRIVEVPFQRGAPIRLLSNRVTVAAGLLAAIAGAWTADQVDASMSRFALSTVARHAHDWYPNADGIYTVWPPSATGARCNVAVTFAGDKFYWRKSLRPIECAVDRSAPPFRLYVVGDSHAMVVERMLRLAVSATGIPVTVLSRVACPIASLMQPDTQGTDECRSFRAQAIEEILAEARPGDVVWLGSLRMPRMVEQGDLKAGSTPRDDSIDPASRSAARREAEALVGRLGQAGLRVVINAPLPVFPSPAFRCSDWFNRANPVCGSGLTVAHARLEGARRPVLDSLEDIAGRRPELRVWDPFPILCPADPCVATSDGRPVFFDGDHLSGFGGTNSCCRPSWSCCSRCAPQGAGHRPNLFATEGDPAPIPSRRRSLMKARLRPSIAWPAARGTRRSARRQCGRNRTRTPTHCELPGSIEQRRCHCIANIPTVRQILLIAFHFPPSWAAAASSARCASPSTCPSSAGSRRCCRSSRRRTRRGTTRRSTRSRPAAK